MTSFWDSNLTMKFQKRSSNLLATFKKPILEVLPLFEASIWNHNNAAFEMLARTNNAVDGWHYGIQLPFRGSHPKVCTFLQKFRQAALLHKFNALQAVTGHQKKRRKNYQQLNARVQTRINSYEENKETIFPFLGSIAHLQ